MSSFAKTVLFVFLFGCIQEVQALRMDLGAGIGFEYSNNVERSATNEEEDIIGIGVIGFSLIENTESIVSDVAAILRYEDYLKKSFDERLLFSLAANSEWRIAAERFHWIVQDNFEQLNINALDPSTPDNTQNVNAFSTGPDFFLHFGSISTLEFGARFEDTYFEASTADSRRYTANTRWLYHSISNKLLKRDFFIEIDVQRVNFKNSEENENFSREDYFLGMEARYSHSELRIEGGGTSIQREGSENFNGPLLSALWSWSLSSLSRFEVAASSQLTDAGRNLLVTDDVTDQTVIQNEEVTSDVFTENRAQLSYYRDGYLLLSRLRAFWIDRDYKETELDRVIKQVRADLGYKFTAALIGSTGVEYQYTREFSTARVDKDILFRLGFSYLLSRDLNAEFGIGYLQRNSNQPDLSFNEMHALVGIMYRFDTIPGRSLFTNR